MKLTASRETLLPAAPPEPTRPVSDVVHERLSATGLLVLRQVEVAEHEGLVRLSGRVPRYYEKQVAQEVALNVAGVVELVNDIAVEYGHRNTEQAV